VRANGLYTSLFACACTSVNLVWHADLVTRVARIYLDQILRTYDLYLSAHQQHGTNTKAISGVFISSHGRSLLGIHRSGSFHDCACRDARQSYNLLRM
jgi:hypothetical protein